MVDQFRRHLMMVINVQIIELEANKIYAKVIIYRKSLLVYKNNINQKKEQKVGENFLRSREAKMGFQTRKFQFYTGCKFSGNI